MGPSKCHPLFILYLPAPHQTSSEEHPGRVLTHTLQVPHSGLKTSHTLAMWPGQGFPFSKPHFPYFESWEVMIPPPRKSTCKGLSIVYGSQ